MKAEFMPTVKLEIRPMVMAICQHMGIENSELSEKIKEAVDYEVQKQILNIPEMVKTEVKLMFNEIINEECDLYARKEMSPEWVRNNKQMVSTFRNTIKTNVQIAIMEMINENQQKNKKGLTP